MDLWNQLLVEDTVSLTEYCQDKSRPQEERRKAFEIICNRFRNDLLKKCEIRCFHFGQGPTVATIVVEAAFVSYARKGNFSFDPHKKSSPDNQFKQYMYAIMKNELTNYHRQEKKKALGKEYTGEETLMTDLPKWSKGKFTPKEILHFEAIESLSPRHRTVYLTHKAHEDKTKKLPEQLRIKLREYLGGVEQTTVRGIKLEAIREIETYMKAYTIIQNNGIN